MYIASSLPFFFAFSLISSAGCEVKVAGTIAQQVFPDPQVAALAEAAAKGDVEEVDRLVKSGVPVDGLGMDRLTPLTFAMLAPNVRGMEALLKNGANPNHRIREPKYIGGMPIILFLSQLEAAPLFQTYCSSMVPILIRENPCGQSGYAIPL